MDRINRPRYLDSSIDLDTPMSPRRRRINKKCPCADILQKNNMKFKEHANAYVYEFDVAGIPKEALNLIIEKDSRVIKLSGKINEKIDAENDIYESSRKVNLAVRIPRDGDIKTIKTILKNGILTIVMKKISYVGEKIKIN